MDYIKVKRIKKIQGLYYIENFIEDDSDIINELDKKKWNPITNNKNSRLVQHYGYIYNYLNYKSNTKTEDLPPILLNIKNKIKELCVDIDLCNDKFDFDQCIVNNYYKNQKISKHIDSLSFDNLICCLTIGCDGIMRFELNDVFHDIIVKKNSLYIMSGDARYKWSHEMLNNKEERRISITYRKIIK